MRLLATYFSCGRDDAALMLSMRSLRAITARSELDILVVSDRKDPVTRFPIGGWMWRAGVDHARHLDAMDSIVNQIRVWQSMADDYDAILKIDSDTLAMHRGEAWERIAAGAGVVGEDGPAYFFSTEALRVAFPSNRPERIESKIRAHYPERRTWNEDRTIVPMLGVPALPREILGFYAYGSQPVPRNEFVEFGRLRVLREMSQDERLRHRDHTMRSFTARIHAPVDFIY